jgi:hypothetical protein
MFYKTEEGPMKEINKAVCRTSTSVKRAKSRFLLRKWKGGGAVKRRDVGTNVCAVMKNATMLKCGTAQAIRARAKMETINHTGGSAFLA